jgi:hypothetical protein
VPLEGPHLLEAYFSDGNVQEDDIRCGTVPVEADPPHVVTSPVTGRAGGLAFVLGRKVDMEGPGAIP